jgi:small-conductance mechanosensitive channel
LISSEGWRSAATLAVIAACVGLNHLWVRILKRSEVGHTPDISRARLVWSKNFLWTMGTVGVIAIWGSKIAGFALSLAAFAGAILLVSKELLVCVLGYLVIAVSKPYRIGQFIELNGYAGRVIDIDVFSTTLSETGSARQLTGKTVALPNSLVISAGVRNLSATGEYIIDLYQLVLPYDCDFEKAEKSAISAAEGATASWREEADNHFKSIEALHYWDLPSSRPKVLWEPLDSRGHTLTIRFSCPLEDRVTTEQEIFRQFWKNYLMPVPATSPGPGLQTNRALPP